MLSIQTSSRLQLCSRCLSHEINSWVNEKWTELDENIKRQVREELTSIELTNGKCIVCNNSLVSKGTSENILSILERNESSKKIKTEFKKLFGFVI